ncbi:MAG: hypothetical protein JWL63_1475 [Rhodocyclales bacterium]|nr:hypothetical protein [Rhodocyclales bacterium]
MTPQDRLSRAVKEAALGQYEEALDEHIWFHNHALEEEPALRGVRLSFALAYWLDLGEKYPPAMAKLLAIRDEKTEKLLNGTTDWHLFNDVMAINETLHDEAATCLLFKEIRNRSEDFALSCSRVAMPSLLKCGDYSLARIYIPDPHASLDRMADDLNEGMEWAMEGDNTEHEMKTEAMVQIYADNVNMLLDAFRKTGDQPLALDLRLRALSLIPDESLRRLVDGRLRLIIDEV